MGRRRQMRVQTSHEVGTEVLTTCGAGPNSFRVLDDYIMDVRATTFFDNAGNEIRTIVHFTVQDRFYSPETGEEFTGTAHTNDEFIGEVERRAAGLEYHVTTPGGGRVFLSAGTMRFDEDGNLIFAGGLLPTFRNPNDLSREERALLANLCEELAGT